MKVSSAVDKPDLYPDRHLNVFVPYGSHDLDYNVTRALIATLRWSVPQLTRDFLAEIAKVATEGSSFQFDLQASDFEDYDPSRAKRKVVVGISTRGQVASRLPSLDAVDQPRLAQALAIPHPHARLEAVRTVLARPDVDADDVAVLAHALEELRQGSLPDGWIFSTDNAACVLIEAKLIALLHQSQLDRHAEVWFGRRREGEDLVLVTWARVAAFFGKHRDDKDARTAFLCRQLFDYLDLLGLAPFEGFKPYDFDGDALQDSQEKFRRYVDEVRRAALSQGAPLGEAQATPLGARLPFSNGNFPGEVRFDLLTDGIRVAWRAGETAPESVSQILAATDDGKKNLLDKVTLSTGFRVRVERLIEGALGPAVDAETYARDFVPAELGEALQALRLQHPNGTGARTPRRGAISIESLIARDAALEGRDAVVGTGARLVFDALRIAEKLQA